MKSIRTTKLASFIAKDEGGVEHKISVKLVSFHSGTTVDKAISAELSMMADAANQVSPVKRLGTREFLIEATGQHVFGRMPHLLNSRS